MHSIFKSIQVEDGQGVAEYAILVAGIAIFCLTALYLMHGKLAVFFYSLSI